MKVLIKISQKIFKLLLSSSQQSKNPNTRHLLSEIWHQKMSERINRLTKYNNHNYNLLEMKLPIFPTLHDHYFFLLWLIIRAEVFKSKHIKTHPTRFHQQLNVDDLPPSAVAHIYRNAAWHERSISSPPCRHPPPPHPSYSNGLLQSNKSMENWVKYGGLAWCFLLAVRPVAWAQGPCTDPHSRHCNWVTVTAPPVPV